MAQQKPRTRLRASSKLINGDFMTGEEMENPTLNKWQTHRVKETWEKDGKMFETVRFEGDEHFTSKSFDDDDLDMDDFDDYKLPNDFMNNGWKLAKSEVSVIELVPNSSYFSVTDKIVEMANGGTIDADEVRGLVKQLIHVEKYSMYSKFQTWIEQFGKDFVMEKILPLKIETHRDLSRVGVKRLGQGFTNDEPVTPEEKA